jgi:hypothetical protein
MGLLEFSVTTTKPCEGEGSFYAIGYYQDDGSHIVERIPQVSLGREYASTEDAEEQVLRRYALTNQLAAMAVAKLCDGEPHGCEEPTLSLVENIIYTLPNELRLPVRRVATVPVVINGIGRTTPYSETYVHHSPTYDPTIFMPYPVDEAWHNPVEQVIQALGPKGLSVRRPVYVALRGDETIVERVPEL